MKFDLFPEEDRPYCLLLVGGTGDTAEIFFPLVEKLNITLPRHTISALTLTDAPIADLLQEQASELHQIFQTLYQRNKNVKFDIFCTSMGAYATIKLITDAKVAPHIRKVLMFDPADYYLDLVIQSAADDVTWSGHQEYRPTGPVISDELCHIHGDMKIDVVHLTLHNLGPSGYEEENLNKRGKDKKGGYPRLNTDMVRSFYDKIPDLNRGEYREVDYIPHGFFRDGNVEKNVEKVATIITKYLKIK